MGFWDSLINGVEDAASWTINNAGSIATAVNTISGLLPAAAQEKLAADPISGENLLPTLYNSLPVVETVLQESADSYLKAPTPPKAGDVREPQINGPIDLKGIFPDTTVVSNGQANQAVNADINKFLSLHDIPTSMGHDSPVDVGQSIGEKMCTPPQPLCQADKNNPNANPALLAPPTFTIGPDEHGLTITGAHNYYKIPLDGNNNGNEAWHSILRLYTQTTGASRKAWADRKKALASAAKKPQHTLDDDKSYNSTSVAANFTTSVNAHETMTKAITTMATLATSSTFKNTGSTSADGQNFVYQFQTDPSVGPTAVLSAFQNCIGTSLVSGVGMPTTKVTQQATIIG